MSRIENNYKLEINESGYIQGGYAVLEGQPYDWHGQFADFKDPEIGCGAYKFVEGEIVLDQEKLAEIKEAERLRQEVADAKAYLANTDYVTIKIAEGVATKEEYAAVLAKRAAARELINQYEN